MSIVVGLALSAQRSGDSIASGNPTQVAETGQILYSYNHDSDASGTINNAVCQSGGWSQARDQKICCISEAGQYSTRGGSRRTRLRSRTLLHSNPACRIENKLSIDRLASIDRPVTGLSLCVTSKTDATGEDTDISTPATTTRRRGQTCPASPRDVVRLWLTSRGVEYYHVAQVLQTCAVCALGGRAPQPTYEAQVHVPPAKLRKCRRSNLYSAQSPRTLALWLRGPTDAMAAFAFARPRSCVRYGTTTRRRTVHPVSSISSSATASLRGPAQSPRRSADACRAKPRAEAHSTRVLAWTSARCPLGVLLHRGHGALARVGGIPALTTPPCAPRLGPRAQTCMHLSAFPTHMYPSKTPGPRRTPNMDSLIRTRIRISKSSRTKGRRVSKLAAGSQEFGGLAYLTQIELCAASLAIESSQTAELPKSDRNS
ncbi:hypothetical protein FB451DRAFT_1364941 [Mycena latifolia]|nr:hypothetical protein FB451DRAFT_1364941 [Mycena latifolia]